MEIPKQLQYPEFRFVKIEKGSKAPFEKHWQTLNNYQYDAPGFQDWVVNAGNCGLVCGYGDVVAIDCDKAEVEDVVRKELAGTLEIQTGSAHTNFIYRCKDAEGNIKEVNDIDGEVFSLRCKNQQVVIPPSIHPNGNAYTLKNNTEIAEVYWNDLINVLSKFMTARYEQEVKEERTFLQHTDLDTTPITNVVSLAGLKHRGSEYQGSHPVHGSKTGMNFCVNTVKNCWHCFRCDSGGGPLSWIAVQEGIINCRDAQAGALKGESFKEILKIAEEKYGVGFEKDNKNTQGYFVNTKESGYNV